MRTILFLIGCCFLMNVAYAKKVNDIDFPDEITVASKKLVLNGVGERLATIFKVHVYTAALYLKEKTKNNEAIISSHDARRVVMVFERDVGKSKIVDAYHEGFENNCDENLVKGELKPEIDRFVSVFSDVKKGNRFEYDFDQNGFELSIDGKPMYKNTNEKFSNCVMSTWIGKHPPNSGLKEGLLGSN